MKSQGSFVRILKERGLSDWFYCLAIFLLVDINFYVASH